MTLSIRQRALILTLLIHGAIFLFLLYAILTTPVPPMGGGEGVLVNIGYMDMASGEIQPMSENITEDPAVIEKVKPVPVDEAPIETQDIEDAPVVVNKTPVKKPEVIKKKEPPVKETPVKKVEPKPVPARVADPRAMYKGKSNNSSSQGTAATGKGDQGDPSGDPNSNLYGKPGNGNGSGNGNGTGTGTGNGNGPGVSFDLAGRSKISLPSVKDNSREEGKVVVAIVVDKTGKVVNVTAPARGSTTTNSELVRKAKEAAMRAVFSASKEGVEEQRGTITFNFINR